MTPTTRSRSLPLVLFALAAGPALAADRVSMAVPGVPPVFSGLVAYVAKEEGFFKKHGVEVEVRPFDSGAAAAQAVVSGNIDLSLSPTPVIVRMVSNAGVDLVGIYGMANPDWLLASTQPGVKCADLKDQAVGVDSVGGARAVALAAFLHACGLKVDQVKLVSLSSNVGAAMIAGQIKVGVLHTDDVPVLEEQMGKKLSIVSTFHEVAPVSHYNLIVSTRKSLEQKRPAYTRVLAALRRPGGEHRDRHRPHRAGVEAGPPAFLPDQVLAARRRRARQGQPRPRDRCGEGGRRNQAGEGAGGVRAAGRPRRVEGRRGAAEEVGARCWTRKLAACGGRRTP